MGAEKKIMMLWICAMVVSSMLMEAGANEQRFIGYPALGIKHPMPCGHNMDKCVGNPSNNYNRGCERLQRCRGGGVRKFMPIIP
ncbi:ralf-like 9 [Hibiscus trionum]|uniref:Ralf-like 9 n=1 Tax=Hibiscus trionum TaxID=183268 RepID=A0A9W7LIA8_HIBTR|nr:ralf-like 9 [Hibiscus trionum]